MEIPQTVLEKAKEFTERYGENFCYIGRYQGKQVFQFEFPEGQFTGFPYIYLYDEHTKEVEEVTGGESMIIIRQCWLGLLS